MPSQIHCTCQNKKPATYIFSRRQEYAEGDHVIAQLTVGNTPTEYVGCVRQTNRMEVLVEIGAIDSLVDIRDLTVIGVVVGVIYDDDVLDYPGFTLPSEDALEVWRDGG